MYVSCLVDPRQRDVYHNIQHVLHARPAQNHLLKNRVKHLKLIF